MINNFTRSTVVNLIVVMKEESDNKNNNSFKYFIGRFAYTKPTNNDKEPIVPSLKTRDKVTCRDSYPQRIKKRKSPKNSNSKVSQYPLDHALSDIIDHNLLSMLKCTNFIVKENLLIMSFYSFICWN